MQFRLYAIVGIVLLVSSIVQSRPVSYAGGWTVMTMNDVQKRSIHGHYSPTSRVSVGYLFQYWPDDHLWLNAIQINRVLMRVNTIHSQANVYVKGAVGVVAPSINVGGFGGLSMDWETRRYFVSYHNRWVTLSKAVGWFQHAARLGMAPYKGNYGDIHTWFMMQVDYISQGDRHITFTPLVRLFKGTHLLEMGMSLQGNVTLNYIFRY